MNNQDTIDRTARTLDRAASLLRRGVWVYALLLGSVLVTIVVGQVLTRYFFGYAPAWVNELSRYLAVWISLPLAAVLIWSDDHLKIDIVYVRLSVRAQRVLQVGYLLVLIVFSLAFAYGGYQYATNSGFRSVSPTMGFEMFWVYLILPVSGVMMAFFAVARLLETFTDDRSLDVDAIRSGGELD